MAANPCAKNACHWSPIAKPPAKPPQRLNEKLFKLVNVKYSTGRRKADQSPSESMETGLASCTGLSILLIDACRSVGVPARLVGTPMWMNMRGNHTWLEVWDDGWHFTGAAEPDPKGLDHTWFQHDASEAQKDSAQHAIYASSFKKTDLAFPARLGARHSLGQRRQRHRQLHAESVRAGTGKISSARKSAGPPRRTTRRGKGHGHGHRQ